MSATVPSFNQSWKSPVVESKKPLPESFIPGEFDVICSRGKIAKSHSGNIYFQSLVEKTAPKYANAKGKLAKSLIVSEIMEEIRRKSPNGGFIKLSGGHWFEVGDWNAREKVSQSLRDILHGQYRSSASSKKRRKDELNAKMVEDIDALIESNEFVSKRIKSLSHTIKTQASMVSDEELSREMTQVNTEILDQLKTDNTLQRKVNQLSFTNDSKKNQPSDFTANFFP